MGKWIEALVRGSRRAAERQNKEIEGEQVRVPSQVLYKQDRARRGEMTREEQWKIVMQKLDPLLSDWELTEGQMNFVIDKVEEQLNLGRHPETITKDELVTLQAYAVDLVDL